MPGVTIRKPRLNSLAARVAHGVDRLPGDQHRHDGRLAGAGGHLHGEPHSSGLACSLAPWMCSQNFSVRLPSFGATSVSQMIVSTASTWQKKGRTILEAVMPPVLQQPRGRGRHLPVVRVRQVAARRRRSRGSR